jgi:hypothetical protein
MTTPFKTDNYLDELPASHGFESGERLALLMGASTLAMLGAKGRRSLFGGLIIASAGLFLFRTGAAWLNSAVSSGAGRSQPKAVSNGTRPLALGAGS